VKLPITLLLIIGLTLSSCTGQTNPNVSTIPPAAFAEKIKEIPGAQIIDVRTPEEYAAQHIDNAKNINWNGDNFISDAQKLDKSKPVFVYCTVGGRSKKAADKLNELGFKTIYNLEGGIMKWNAAGMAPKSDKIIGMCSQEYGELLQSGKKVLVDFYADWCEPCKKMSRYIVKMQKDMAADVTIIRLNADENKTLISELKIDELPALLLYQNKEMKWKHLGFIGEEDLKKQLQ
jgi:rhodanese-related sulfurtransferase